MQHNPMSYGTLITILLLCVAVFFQGITILWMRTSIKFWKNLCGEWKEVCKKKQDSIADYELLTDEYKRMVDRMLNKQNIVR